MPKTDVYIRGDKSSPSGGTWSGALVAYYRSGWIFLLPYLGFYLLYVWIKGPLNPSLAASGASIPSLLDIYRALHGIHLVGAVAAVRHSIHDAPQGTERAFTSTVWQIVPWCLLGLLFWLPGAYLEFPADPWEHFARINNWRELSTIGPSPGWFYKGHSYFFAYSLVGRLSADLQVRGLGAYQAAVSLLLSWQYYRLAKACGLKRPAALLFTCAQALVFGNDLFGFYRYYGLASTTFSQIAATAAIRTAVSYFQSPVADTHSRLRFRAAFLATLLFAILLAGFNHIQGMAIIGLGLLAASVHYIVRHRPRLFLSLTSLLAILSLLFTWLWPNRPLLDAMRSGGWLNATFGFNLLSPSSPAFRRMVLILGTVGFANLAAAIFLIRRNHIAGWLTVIPVLALLLPPISMPLANAFGAVSPTAIVAFHRFLFAIPPGLALFALGESIWSKRLPERAVMTARVIQGPAKSWRNQIPLGLLVACCALLVILPAGYPYHNRMWSALARTPDDLRFSALFAEFIPKQLSQPTDPRAPLLLIASAGHSVGVQAYRPISSFFTNKDRLMHSAPDRSPAFDLERVRAASATVNRDYYRVLRYLPLSSELFTPRSDSAILSGHWNPNEVALAYTRD
ncbi:MAG: hypothetical protein ABIO94_02150 [Opitutaceae bacterium]